MSSFWFEGERIRTMIKGSSTRGVEKSSGAQVTTMSGIRDEPCTSTIAPSTSA